MPLTQVTSRLIEDTLRYVLGASGTDHYTFTGKGLTGAVNDPTLYLNRGHTYIFENRNASGQHPFYIKTSIANGGTNDQYSTGVTNNGGAGGTEIVFTVPHDAPDLLYYQCSSHINMAGQFKISGSVTDGSITEGKLASNAVTTIKIANANVTNDKLAGDIPANKLQVNDANIIIGGAGNDGALQTLSGDVSMDRTGAVTIADQAVTLSKLEHGTSSNDGKFLRANNGADPSFETITVPVGIPSGGIIIWSGAANAIPSGFVLCDGNNSTPDLRNRFIVGAGDSYSVGNTGGSNTATDTVSISGSDTVNISVSGTTGGGGGSYTAGLSLAGGSTLSAAGHTHSFSGSGSDTVSISGSDTVSVDTRSPYYALCYIMKT